MLTPLVRAYRQALFLFVALFVVLMGGGLLYPFYRAEENRVRSDIEQHIAGTKAYYDLLLTRMDEQVAALTSRTQIRIMLLRYLEGGIGLDELRSYSIPRYADGISVYRGVVGAARFDMAGNTVARAGDSSALSFRRPDGAQKYYAIRRPDATDPYGRVLLEIRHEIRERGAPIGQDAVLFDISSSVKEEDRISFRLVDRTERDPAGSEGEVRFVETSFPPIALSCRYAPSVARPKIGDFIAPFAVFSISLLGLVGLGAYFTVYRASRDMVASYIALADRRALQMREADHRIKNNLNIVSGIVTMHMKESGPSPILEDIRSRIVLIGLIHDRLYRLSDSNSIPLKPYLAELADTLIAAHSSASRNRVEVEGEGFTVDEETCVGVGMIVSELMLNALKYALAPGDAIRIDLSAEDGNWKLDFRNGGKLFPADIDPLTTSSFGLELIRSYVGQLGGRLAFERHPCTRFLFSFPKRRRGTWYPDFDAAI